PIERFRASVHKVMSMHKGTRAMTAAIGIGAEPGIDPRRESADLLYGHIHQRCQIEICDYSGLRSSFGRMSNRQFVDIMSSDMASARDSWVKVRWINIAGMSWDVIRAVAIRYDLHPLAVEDMVHARNGNSSKADYHAKHLFLRVLCHELVESAESMAAFDEVLGDMPRTESPLPYDDAKEGSISAGREDADDEMTVFSKGGSAKSTIRRRRRFWLPTHNPDIENTPLKVNFPRTAAHPYANKQMAAKKKLQDQERSIEALKRQGQAYVPVNVYPVHIFLTRDGTVISIQPNSDPELTSPITRRLQQIDSTLRSSADPSILVQSLLDLIVDKAIEVIDEYQGRIKMFERDVLLKPDIKVVRNLHLLSGDLIMHKRTLEPIKTLVYGLRVYDRDRCAAILEPEQQQHERKKWGYMSYKSKIYLADVYDHMEYVLSSLDMFASTAENLIGYTFNMTSYQMNDVMRRLTLATIIFLPLTLLTGYFGMNFHSMWSLGHSDLFFWEIAIPMMIFIVPSFTRSDIKRGVRYLHKRIVAKEAIEVRV
ncbi:hypothetical protein FISHEDRAFT_9157, partial [Fistulina hepatica ATCC 64428]